MNPQRLSQKELISAIKDAKGHENIKFCFLLGAGASVTSGIPSGEKLSAGWYKEIKERKNEKDFADWKEKEEIDEKDLASSYPKIYQERFRANREIGYAQIQKLFANKEPSVGYAYFAKLLAENGNKFVITTNFDTLIEDALFDYTRTRPLVCGHESLASYINLHTGRPTIVKVHRDILLDPISDKKGVADMHEQWQKALRPILSSFHLIVIGYNGNDGSVMEYLKALRENRKPIYWCVRGKKELPEKIKEVLTQNDYVVDIDGFDELAIELCAELGVEIDIIKVGIEDSEIVKNAKNRAERFIEQLNELGKQESEKADKTKTEMPQTIKEILPKWWEYHWKIEKAKTSEEKEEIYKEGIRKLPNSHELIGNYANFLHTIRKDYNNAEMYYKKALELDPEHAAYNGNYAGFLLGLGRKIEGKKYLDKAFGLQKDENDLAVELWFYALAHVADRRDEARRELDRLLAGGVRSIGWDFSPNIERAEKDGYPDMDELREYARKITTE